MITVRLKRFKRAVVVVEKGTERGAGIRRWAVVAGAAAQATALPSCSIYISRGSKISPSSGLSHDLSTE